MFLYASSPNQSICLMKNPGAEAQFYLRPSYRGIVFYRWLIKKSPQARFSSDKSYYEDYTVREIAEILNLSESNVKIRLMRGRKLLKQALKEEWGDDE